MLFRVFFNNTQHTHLLQGCGNRLLPVSAGVIKPFYFISVILTTFDSVFPVASLVTVHLQKYDPLGNPEPSTAWKYSPGCNSLDPEGTETNIPFALYTENRTNEGSGIEYLTIVEGLNGFG